MRNIIEFVDLIGVLKEFQWQLDNTHDSYLVCTYYKDEEYSDIQTCDMFNVVEHVRTEQVEVWFDTDRTVMIKGNEFDKCIIEEKIDETTGDQAISCLRIYLNGRLRYVLTSSIREID